MSASLSRRGLLQAAGAASTAVAAPGIARAATHPDTRLIALCNEAETLEARSNALTGPYMDVPGRGPDWVWTEARAITAQIHALVEEAAATKTHTLQGLQAKARMMMLYAQRTIGGQILWGNHDELMGWSIAHDLLGLEMPAIGEGDEA